MTNRKETIFQSGPLFSEAERAFHRTLSACLRDAGHDVIWGGSLLTEEQIEDADVAAPGLIFSTCRDAIENCTCLVALLDGTQVDDGTAWEIGYAYAKGIPVYGLRTDFRNAGDTKCGLVNSMIQGSLAGFASDAEKLIDILSKKYSS